MSVDGSQLVDADAAPSRAAIAGAAVCAGAAVLLAVTTALVTFGLAESYGFGPGWDWSAFVMTGAVAIVTGAAVLGAIRLARLQWRPLPVVVAAVAAVLVVGYIAGLLGNLRHH